MALDSRPSLSLYELAMKDRRSLFFFLYGGVIYILFN